MAITCTTADTPQSGLRSESRCSGNDFLVAFYVPWFSEWKPQTGNEGPRGKVDCRGSDRSLRYAQEGVTYAWNYIDRDSALSPLWCAAPVVPQSKLGLYAERRNRVDPCHCCDSATSRQDLNCAYQHAEWGNSEAPARAIRMMFSGHSGTANWRGGSEGTSPIRI
jgi:hypothetical protein